MAVGMGHNDFRFGTSKIFFRAGKVNPPFPRMFTILAVFLFDIDFTDT